MFANTHHTHIHAGTSNLFAIKKTLKKELFNKDKNEKKKLINDVFSLKIHNFVSIVHLKKKSII